MVDILDKMTNKLNKGVATISANSKALIEKTQINTKIKTLEAERDQMAATLGMQVYENLTKGDDVFVDEAMRNIVSEISKRITQITEQRTEIEKIDYEVNLVKGERTASGTDGVGNVCVCGQELTLDVKFCATCGAPQPEQSEQPVETGKACSCGNSLAEGIKFCGKCGSAVDTTPINSEEPKVEAAVVTCACGHILAEGVKFCGKCGSPQKIKLRRIER